MDIKEDPLSFEEIDEIEEIESNPKIHPIHNAKFKSLNPVAFGNKKNDEYSILNAQQRYRTTKEFGYVPRGKIENFTVKKPLAPNILDKYQSERIRERGGGIKRVSVINEGN